jgi:glycosyltransferase involved in cell wall biosynthesis
MKLLFLFQQFNFDKNTLYSDLLFELVRRGHEVTVLAGTQREVDESRIAIERGCEVIYFRVSNQFIANKFKKGLIQLGLESRMLLQLMRHLRGRRFDAVVYPTPPITLANVVHFCREAFGASSYLMLKDIFPQNAVDLKMLHPKGLPHRYFQALERRLYRVSDHIGCMSSANVEYMRRQLPAAEHSKLELFPNTIRVEPRKLSAKERNPDEPLRFMYGGNLGKPQAIDFLLNCIRRLGEDTRVRFLIVGAGTESEMVEHFIRENRMTNLEYHPRLPKDDYLNMLAKCDVGLLLLRPEFTIPNYPSRVLSYFQECKPVLAATDEVSDIRSLIEREARCGLWCPSSDEAAFIGAIHEICELGRERLGAWGRNGYRYLKKHFSVERSADILEAHFANRPALPRK